MRVPNVTPGRGLAASLALALGLGCAGAPKKPDREPLPDEPGGPAPGAAAAAAGADPMAAGAGPALQVDRRKISEEDRGDFDKAVTKYEAAKRAGRVKAECDKLASEFKSVADDNAQLLEARHNQAALLFECGKDGEAVRIWESLANGPKPYAPALSALGYLAWKGGDVYKAETLFGRAIQADKQAGSIGAYLNLAQIQREKARQARGTGEKQQLIGQAIENLRRVLAIDGNNLQAYAILCYFYFDLELYDVAKLVGDQAIGRAQEIATGKFLGSEEEDVVGGGAAAASKRPARGKRGAKEAKDDKADEDAAPKASKEVAAEGTGYTVEMKKQLGMVYNTLGLVELKRNKISLAIANFKRAIEMDPEHNEARMNAAALSLKYRDYKTAEENFRAVLTAQPKNYEATIGLGVALRGNRKIEEAEQMYLAAQKLAPNNPETYFNLGVLYQEYKGVGDKVALQKAQDYYRQYVGKNGPRRREAEKRIKDIDEMFAALAEAEKLQKEAEEMQRKMEEQQKKMEEELKKMQEQEKQQAGGAQPTASAAPGAPGGEATAATTAPPPVAEPEPPAKGKKKK
jgi:tetratricopeptide (TPR) repeat protein